jgi:hypothetical protein
MFLAKLSFWPKMHIGQKCVLAKTAFWPNILAEKAFWPNDATL